MIAPLISECRGCASPRLRTVFEMGSLPLANGLRETRDPAPRYPLTLLFCERCSLVQLRETLDPSVLFSADYLYYSSQSRTMVESSRLLVERLVREESLGPFDLVMEAASNDGYLLQHYVGAGLPVVGVDPAKKIADLANSRGVLTLPEFFTRKFATNYAGKVTVFHANNVLGHVADQNDFVAGVEAVLRPGGLAVFEVPYLGKMIDDREFDTIYHEHLCYFSLAALDFLFARHGLTLVDAEWLPIHGGSVRLFVRKSRCSTKRQVDQLIDQESQRGLLDFGYYADFGTRVNALGTKLWRTFDRIHRAQPGARFAGYGAAAKGNQLLSYLGVDFLEFVVDSTPVKVGKFMAGVDAPVVAEAPGVLDGIDYTLLLAWNFRGEIMAKHPEHRGNWIVPIPDLSILTLVNVGAR